MMDLNGPEFEFRTSGKTKNDSDKQGINIEKNF